jgi:putative hydrolase of HD superfamily
MEGLIEFFISVGQLKVRPGWVLKGVKNPETFAEHTFRLFVLGWLFSRGRELNAEKLLKMTLIHSLSAVFVDYLSPYDQQLGRVLENEKGKAKPLLNLQMPASLKGRASVSRPDEEEKAIRKLTAKLPTTQKKELYSLWLDFQTRKSPEAKFVGALDKLENLIQAHEYGDHVADKSFDSFMEEVKEENNDKAVVAFSNQIKAYFEGRKISEADKVLIEFILNVGKLKILKRVGWIYGGAKEGDTESVADHSFRLAIMVWFLAQTGLNIEKMMKMAIGHDFATIYTGDITPFDGLITHNLSKDKATLEKWPQRSREEKEKLTAHRRLNERKALDQLLAGLPVFLSDEMMGLWFEYEEGFSKEGRFVRQVDRIEKLIQALEYNVKGIYKLDIAPYWVQLKQLIDNPSLKDFVEGVDKGFYGRGEDYHQFIDKLILEM